MASDPLGALTDVMLDGTERIRVGRKMRDADGNRTGPVKAWTTGLADIVKWARRVAPSISTGPGEPSPSAGFTGDLYIDAVSGDFYRKDA